MQPTELFTDEEAVSPVIGVILMVAITVILAAVIGTFVLGLGDELDQNAPQASFTFDYTEDTTNDASSLSATDPCDVSSGATATNDLTVTHDGGDKIPAGQLSISTAVTDQGWEACSGLAADSDVTAGSSADAEAASDQTVRVTWQSTSGGDTATLGKWTGPDA